MSVESRMPVTAPVAAPRTDPMRRPRGGAWRSAVVFAVFGVATVLPFYVWLYGLQSRGSSAAAIGMASMGMQRMSVYWAFPLLQATGFAALIWAYLGVALGLTESGRRVRWLPLTRSQADRVHRQISLLVIALVLAHALATAFDAMGDNFLTAFVPWQEGWTAAVFSYNIGIFAFYLALLLGPTYYLRRHIGVRTWRFAHRFSVVVYILSVWHTLILGADVGFYGWLRPFIWLAQLPLLALFVRRLLKPAARRKARAWVSGVRYTLAGTGCAAIVAIVAIVADGSYANVVRNIH